MSLEAITLSSPPLESKKPLGAGLAGVDGLPSQDSKVSPSFPTYGSHKSLGRAALVPMVMVVIWSLGMGSILLVWLLAKRVPLVPGSWSHIFDGYLVVDEGNKTGSVETLDGQETLESTMTGVLIITAISHFSSMAVIPLMSLGAFYVAAMWLDDQTKSKQGPTPLQLGLVAQMCSSGTWDSVLLTSRYLLRNWRTKSPATRAQVSSLLHCALGICSTVVILHYAVIITDLLLSAELGSAYYPLLSEVDVHSGTASTLGTQYNSALYEVPPSPEDDVKRYMEALETISGGSSRNKIVTITNYNSSGMEDTSSMAVITRPHVPFSWSWKASTMGIRARCRPAPCNSAPKEPKSISCPPHSEPDDNFPLPSFDYVTPSVHHAYYITGYSPTGEELQGLIPKNASERENNSFYFIMAVRQDSLAYDAVHAHSVELKDTGLNFIYIGLCEVNLYDIEVSYDGFRAFTGDSRTLDINSLYSIASHPVQMLHDEAMRVISKPSDYLNLKIIETLGPATFYDQGTPGFSDKLSAEFARQFLSLVSAFSAAMAPAITVTDYSAKLVSRYPLMRTLAYIGVVYAHGLFAIILYVGVVGRSSRTVVVDEVVEYVNWKGELVAVKQKPVQELLLVQSRLTDSLVIVAEHFLWLSADTAEKQGISTGALSAQRSAVEMFNVEDQDTVRVDIGLIKGQDGQRWYGLKHRKGDILLENTENIV